MVSGFDAYGTIQQHADNTSVMRPTTAMGERASSDELEAANI